MIAFRSLPKVGIYKVRKLLSLRPRRGGLHNIIFHIRSFLTHFPPPKVGIEAFEAKVYGFIGLQTIDAYIKASLTSPMGTLIGVLPSPKVRRDHLRFTYFRMGEISR